MRHAELRASLVALCQALARRGHLAGTGGNVALRIDADHFAVTPSALDYAAMQAQDICVLRLADLARVDGQRAPSVESSLHAGVLRARPDVHCSIHTHQPVASACALLGQPLAVPPRWQTTLGERVPLVGYAPSGTGWLAAKLARALQRHCQAYLLFDHGALCCGASPDAAAQVVEDLEALARQHLAERIAARAQAQPAQRAALLRVLEALHAGAAAGP